MFYIAVFTLRSQISMTLRLIFFEKIGGKYALIQDGNTTRKSQIKIKKIVCKTNETVSCWFELTIGQVLRKMLFDSFQVFELIPDLEACWNLWNENSGA